MKTIRVGIIGMGGFGITEAEVVRSMPNAELVAGVRRTPEAAQQLSARFDIPVYQDWLVMLTTTSSTWWPSPQPMRRIAT